MYRLLDLHNCQNDIRINAKQPSAVLDTADIAISAFIRAAILIYCNRAFIQEHGIEHKYGFHSSIRESLPDLWQRFKEPEEYEDNACYTAENLENGTLPGLMWNAGETVRSVNRMSLLQKPQGVKVVTGHDLEAWKELKQAPEYYD